MNARPEFPSTVRARLVARLDIVEEAAGALRRELCSASGIERQFLHPKLDKLESEHRSITAQLASLPAVEKVGDWTDE